MEKACAFPTAFPNGLPYNKIHPPNGGEEVAVIYIDSVFLLNTVMDYLLCLLAARLAGIPLRRGRYLAAALAGGLYAVAIFLPGCAFLSALPVKVSAGILMALIAYGGEQQLLRLTLLLFALSCGMAGGVLALGLLANTAVPMVNGVFYTDINGKVLWITAAAAYALLTLVFRASAKHGVHGELLSVRVSILGNVAAFTALWDNGNSLRDPADGSPVLVLAPSVLRGCLPNRIRVQLTAEKLQSPVEGMELLVREAPELHPRLLPYHAVGTASGLLLGIRTDWVEIGNERCQGGIAALSPTELGNEYRALWGGEVRKEGKHGTLESRRSMAAETAWADRSDSLHRGQRHAASAPYKGTGG